jgi:hypothetical protein
MTATSMLSLGILYLQKNSIFFKKYGEGIGKNKYW